MPARHPTPCNKHHPTRRLLVAALLASAYAVCVANAGCAKAVSRPDPPARDCAWTVWAHALRPGAVLGLTGSWNNWDGVSVPMELRDDGWYLAYFLLPPGEYGYLIVEDERARIDDFNPLTMFRDDDEVSLLISEDCSVPKIQDSAVLATADGRARVSGVFYASSTKERLAPSSVWAQTADGIPIRVEEADPTTGGIVVEATGLSRGKHTVTIRAKDTAGREAEESRSVVWIAPAAETWRDGILYQVMVDRFLGDGGAVLSPPTTAGSRAGGTLKGVQAAIENGQLEQLGVTAVWLSPVYLNPEEAREGPWDHRMYEGYHGYWPLESRVVDPRLGGEQALRALVASAHSRGIRVILDIVPNHVYEENPIYLAHRNDGWFHDGPEKCMCGDPQCSWATHIETCWFTSYLPDFRWQNPLVMQHGSRESLWWVEEFDLDGVRIDAVPMMPRAATRRIAHTVRSSPSIDRFILGEVYTGGGQEGIDQIRYHLGSAGLESAFDFPLMWALRSTIAYGAGNFSEVASIFMASEASYADTGATMSLIVGNHDTTRFVSEANGDADNDPWDNPPVQPTVSEPYARHLMAMTVALTFPGLPVIYYGDEVALAGGGDPDCRRVMPDASALIPFQTHVLDKVRRLGQLRRCSNALRRGKLLTLRADSDMLAYVRDVGDGMPVLVAMSRAASAKAFTLMGGEIPSGTYTDVLSGDVFFVGEAGAGATFDVESLSGRVLVSSVDPCR